MASTSRVQPQSGPALGGRLAPFFILFFASGFPALLYQIVWQRALFTIYGVNIESVTVIVTVFMLGLGLGSIAGGQLSTCSSIPLLAVFGAIELSIAAFGSASLWIFHRVGLYTAGSSIAATGLATFLLLLIPTMLMGSTLPLLVAYMVRRTANVGESVGSLYFVNTLGSGAACLFAAFFLMRVLGETGSIRLAAAINAAVAITAFLLHTRSRHHLRVVGSFDGGAAVIPTDRKTLSYALAMVLAAAAGFISLAYEIVWYRLYSYTSGGPAPCFAILLGFYLFGIAYGSLAVRDLCRKKLKHDLRRTLQAASIVVLLGSIVACLLGPALSFLVGYIPYGPTFTLVFVGAALLGAAFPLLSHASIPPAGDAGRRLSYIYLSNIVGSALGSFIVGFVVLNCWSTRATSLMLLALGFLVASLLAFLARSLSAKKLYVCSSMACLALALFSGPLFARLYERLLFKTVDDHRSRFINLVENRSGVIAVDSAETVYGGGIYDGHFNIDPIKDTNGIFRAYAIAALHAAPRQVLIVGLSSGSWAQIVANHPDADDVTIVEINPGYLNLIRQRPGVASLLQNPKVHIVIDDGRRWLISHPGRKFDFILMNTTFNWRANVSNLLSVDFLQIVRGHLKPGGVHYYNTTESDEVQITGAAVFPYALRVSNFMAVSDSPIVFDRARWKSVLMRYRIDGRAVFDLSNPDQRARLDQIVSLPEAKAGQRIEEDFSVETRPSLTTRLKGRRLITDDNMGTEWQALTGWQP